MFGKMSEDAKHRFLGAAIVSYLACTGYSIYKIWKINQQVQAREEATLYPVKLFDMDEQNNLTLKPEVKQLIKDAQVTIAFNKHSNQIIGVNLDSIPITTFQTVFKK